jgi:hypothetical protein
MHNRKIGSIISERILTLVCDPIYSSESSVRTEEKLCTDP